MLGSRLVKLIEQKSDELSEGVAEKLRSSSRTPGYRDLAHAELAKAAKEVFSNLSDWLLTKTESDVELRFTETGMTPPTAPKNTKPQRTRRRNV